MFNISSKQHSKILGFALIGYSWSLFISSLKVFNILPEMFDRTPKILSDYGLVATLIYLYQDFVNLIYLIIVLISATSILKFDDKRRYIALIFIPFAIDLFPLGTILSLYVLLYLFVMSENKLETEITNQTKI